MKKAYGATRFSDLYSKTNLDEFFTIACQLIRQTDVYP